MINMMTNMISTDSKDIPSVSATTVYPSGTIQLQVPANSVQAWSYREEYGLTAVFFTDELTLQAIIDTGTEHIAKRHEAEALTIDADSELVGSPKEERE